MKALRSRPRLRRVLIGSALLTLALVVWSFVIEPRRLVVDAQALELPGWPDQLAGFRVVVLTDLHVGSPGQGIGTLRRIVERANALEPDVVLVPGDVVIHGVVGGRFVAPEDAATELRALRARHGVFGVLGNHDWWLDGPRVSAALASAGITMLEDSALAVADGRLWLAGVSDYREGAHDVGRALRDVPGDAPTIVFTHNPDVFPDVPARVTLTVAGHTHGGQVDLPLIGPPVVPSRYGRRYAEGHVIEDGRHLFVSPGTGTSILPVRFRVPPEVTLLILVPE